MNDHDDSTTGTDPVPAELEALKTFVARHPLWSIAGAAVVGGLAARAALADGVEQRVRSECAGLVRDILNQGVEPLRSDARPQVRQFAELVTRWLSPEEAASAASGETEAVNPGASEATPGSPPGHA